jgi:putative transposase
MQPTIKLLPGNYYHVYNRGNNKETIFRESRNYDFFLNLYKKYIPKVCDTLAYCLMSNHFHFLVKVKQNTDPVKTSLRFSHLFNSYTQSYNLFYNRTGALFQRAFKRKLAEDEDYLRILVQYIHLNPVKHKVTKNFENYKWSSYNLILSNDRDFILTDEVISLFDDLENFIYIHKFEPEVNLDDDLEFE